MQLKTVKSEDSVEPPDPQHSTEIPNTAIPTESLPTPNAELTEPKSPTDDVLPSVPPSPLIKTQVAVVMESPSPAIKPNIIIKPPSVMSDSPPEPMDITQKPKLIRWLPYILYYIVFVCIYVPAIVYLHAVLSIYEDSFTYKWTMSDDLSWDTRNQVNECLNEVAASPGCSHICSESTQPATNPASILCLNILSINLNVQNVVPRLRIAYKNHDLNLRHSLAEFALQNSNGVMTANGWNQLDTPTVRLLLYLTGVDVVISYPCVLLSALTAVLIFALILFLKNSDRSFGAQLSRISPSRPVLWKFFIGAIIGCWIGNAIGTLINVNLTALGTLYSMDENFRLRYSPNSVAELFCGAFQPNCGVLAFGSAVRTIHHHS